MVPCEGLITSSLPQPFMTDGDGDYFTMQMAGDEYPPLSSLKEKSERLAVDQEGRDFYDDNDDGDDVAGDDGVDDGEEECDLTEGQ